MTKTRSVAEVALSMGIGENLLYKWRSDEKTKETPAESEIWAADRLRIPFKVITILKDYLN
jgi:transposase-like protein